MAKLSDIFNMVYGNSFALNQLIEVDKGVAFVSRTSKNNGVSALVEPIDEIEPFEAGPITVALSGMSVLEANVQPYKFYTGYHVMVLTPKNNMSLSEKLFYCMCIKQNKYKYYFGRQANRTLGELEVPTEVPKWAKDKTIEGYGDDKANLLKGDIPKLKPNEWKSFNVTELFNITTGKGPLIRNAKDNTGDTPLISSTQFNNGIVARTGFEPIHLGGTLTLAKNGSVGETFYHSYGYVATSDVLVLEPKFIMTPYTAMFFITILKKEKHRYHYGRKWTKELMENQKIRLPEKDGKVDLDYMETYVKKLRLSKYI
jgi:hypothetical protein